MDWHQVVMVDPRPHPTIIGMGTAAVSCDTDE